MPYFSRLYTFTKESIGAGAVVIPYLHVGLDGILERVVELELLVRGLDALERPLEGAPLLVIGVIGYAFALEAVARVSSLVACLSTISSALRDLP